MGEAGNTGSNEGFSQGTRTLGARLNLGVVGRKVIVGAIQ
jgi:hypothetical protein